MRTLPQDEEGKFPAAPMGELAGRAASWAALHFAQSVNGGPGKLLANVTGVETPSSPCWAAVVVSTGAAELAAFGNEVRILDVNMNTMLAAKKTSPASITYAMISNRSNLEKCLRESDVIINAASCGPRTARITSSIVRT